MPFYYESQSKQSRSCTACQCSTYSWAIYYLYQLIGKHTIIIIVLPPTSQSTNVDHPHLILASTHPHIAIAVPQNQLTSEPI